MENLKKQSSSPLPASPELYKRARGVRLRWLRCHPWWLFCLGHTGRHCPAVGLQFQQHSVNKPSWDQHKAVLEIFAGWNIVLGNPKHSGAAVGNMTNCA